MIQYFFRSTCKYLMLTLFYSFTIPQVVLAASPKKDFYQIEVYRLKNNEQVKQTDEFLKEAYVPALHQAGIAKVGVFKPIGNDTATVKMIYVFIPFKSSDEWMKLSQALEKDASYKTAAKN